MNIRQALRWAVDTGAAQLGLQLVGGLKWYWYYRGSFEEAQQWIESLLTLPGATTRTAARARALSCSAFFNRATRQLVGAQAVSGAIQARVAEAVAIAREVGDKAVLAFVLWLLGGWVGRVDYSAGRALLEESEALYRGEVDEPRGVPGALNMRGDIEWERGDAEAARALWSESLRLSEQDGDPWSCAMHLRHLGMAAYHEGDYASAYEHLAEGLRQVRVVGDLMSLSHTLACLGTVACARGDTVLARACYEEKLALWRKVGNRAGVSSTMDELGTLAQQEGDYGQAQALFEEALTLRRELRHSADVAASQVHLGSLTLAQGDGRRAARYYAEGLRLLGASGDRTVAADCLAGLAAVAGAHGDLQRAARLAGAASALRPATYVLSLRDDRAAHDLQVTALPRELGEAAFATAWAAGQAMTLEEAIAYALQDDASC
jgi:tetratricopeptide (TPR) repeat protein